MTKHNHEEGPETMVNAKVPAAMARRLKERAKAEDRSVSAILRRLIAGYLSRKKSA